MSNEPPEYRLRPMAEADLEGIWLYGFKTWSADQADRYHAEFVAAFSELAGGRKIGRPVDVMDGYLKYAVGSHIVFYRKTKSGIEVIRVLHQRQDVRRHLP
jgi:Plasmid stabilization system protein